MLLDHLLHELPEGLVELHILLLERLQHLAPPKQTRRYSGMRSIPNFKLFSMLIIRTLENYPDSRDFLQLYRDFVGRERPLGRTPRVREDP